MSRKVVPLSGDTVHDLPDPCRECVFWETGHRRPDAAAKADWVSSVLLDWGGCGRLLYVDGELAAFAVYALPQYVASSASPAVARTSSDAALLMTLRVLPEYAASGFGRLLVQAVVKDLLRRRDIRAIEAIGDAQGHELACVMPARFLTAVGFKTVQPHPRYPRLRLDLRNVLTWRTEVEVALERMLGAIRPDKAPARPVGINPRDSESS